MNRSLVRGLIGLIVVVAIVAIGAFAYIYVTGGSTKATGVLNAPALTVTESADSPSGAQKVYKIDSSASEVSFTLDEILMGKPNTVVGKTKQVAGEVLVDTAKPANSKIGTIRISARDLATDSGMRDRMIRSQILQSSKDQFEFIQFVPTGLTGLPDTVTPGTPVKFKAAGNLTIRDITAPVTFEVTVTLAADHLEGSATTTVKRADFKLEIPKVPSVTEVTDEVKLAIDFKATPAASDGAEAADASSASTQAATQAPTQAATQAQ